MKRNSKKVIVSIAGLKILIAAIILSSCSTNHLLISKDESILNWMKNENVPTVGICMIENAKIRQVKMFGNIEHHSPAPLNTNVI